MAEATYLRGPSPSIPPPPPIYSQTSPPTFHPAELTQPTEPPNNLQYNRTRQSLTRKPLPSPKIDVGAPLQHTTSSTVHISPHPSLSNLRPSSALIEQNGSTISLSNSRSTSGNFEDFGEAPPPPPHGPPLPTPSDEPPQPPVSLPHHLKPSRSLTDVFKKSRSGAESPQDHRVPHPSPQDNLGLRQIQTNRQDVSRHSSKKSMDSNPQSVELQPQLQYHHAPYQEPPPPSSPHINHRGSGAFRSASDGSSTSETGPGAPIPNQHLDPSNQHLAPNRNRESRNSINGRGIPRPNSAYSSMSDLATRGRTRSPQLSPNSYDSQGRTRSAHSRASPDARPLSYVDLLNVPYPQPAPAPANLNHAHLQTAVGNNASLLSTKKTFEMYCANVKKTQDPAIQYKFAEFMISAAQEASISSIDENDNPISGKAGETAQADLLREAKSILQRLSDRSYPFAQYYLADGYASGLFSKGKEDYDKAFPLFVSASKHGHAESGYRAALCYEFGWGSRVDAQKAVQFYRHAASKNHPGAMSRLGRACLTGDMGLTKRYREGIKWLKRAAESADLQYNSAPYELGCLHETGYGDDVFRDESYTAQLFTKSADLGHPEANYRLGDAYEHGKLACPRDPALSVHFYTGAAQTGHPLAMMALCAWYMVGAEPVLEKDENEAYEWARKAAECGLAKAEYAVGYFTEMGIGCRRDPLEANAFYVRAADQGEERAKVRIAAIREAASGGPTIESGKKMKKSGSGGNVNVANANEADKKGKRFGIF